MSTENAELRAKIDDAKRSRLPLPSLMQRPGLGAHAKKNARCPFPGHDDKHPSFSAFQGEDGFWHYNCFSSCGSGDEIMFLRKLKGLSLTEAMNLYLEMANFPARHPKSREYPELPKSLASPKSLSLPESPCVSCVSVSPVSEGQELEKELRELAARNACTHAQDRAERKRFKLARDVRAVEKKIGRELTPVELRQTCDEWDRASVPFLGFGDDDHFGMFLAELTKVRVPTGEGDTINKALENVSKLPDADLPLIPGYPDAPKSCRKLTALHREMSHLCKGNTYFLSYRDGAKVCEGLSHQEAR